MTPYLLYQQGTGEQRKTKKYENTKYKHSPYYKAAKLWDTLAVDIIDSTTIGELIKRLKVLYAQFDQHYYVV